MLYRKRQHFKSVVVELPVYSRKILWLIMDNLVRSRKNLFG